MKLYIRNMACESCKVVVRDALQKLKLRPIRVELGEAEIDGNLLENQKQKLNTEIRKVGLEIVESKGGILIEKIKRNVVEYVNLPGRPKVNFSDYLCKKMHYEYSYLSNIFSEVQAFTITHYVNLVKIERAKEMMLFEDLTLSQISEKLHYSNLSNFSAQFKKITGFPPSYFKSLKDKRRRTIDDISISK